MNAEIWSILVIQAQLIRTHTFGGWWRCLKEGKIIGTQWWHWNVGWREEWWNLYKEAVESCKTHSEINWTQSIRVMTAVQGRTTSDDDLILNVKQQHLTIYKHQPLNGQHFIMDQIVWRWLLVAIYWWYKSSVDYSLDRQHHGEVSFLPRGWSLQGEVTRLFSVIKLNYPGYLQQFLSEFLP